MSRWAALSVSALVAVVASWTTLAGQAPAGGQTQPPVFRGGVNFVSVDVFPRRDGRVVEGLTKADFQVFEDGKPQAVETFEFVHVDANPADADRRDPTDEQDALRQAADPHNRLFVVFLDLAHTTIAGSHEARRPVVDFLTRTIGASDLFGVMTPEIPVGQMVFGRRTESIDAQLEKYWTWGQADVAVIARTPYERRLDVCGLLLSPAAPIGDALVRLSREDALQTSLESLMERLRDLRDERKNVLFISEGWVPRGPQPQLASHGTGDVPTTGIGTPTGNRTGGNQRTPVSDDRAWCDREAGRLANMDFDQRYRALLTSAARANVAFYPIDVGGLKGSAIGRAEIGRPEQAAARDVNARGAMQTLRELAENTGGLAIVNTNDLGAGVTRVSDDLASFYLLGYNSTNGAHDGRYRKIEVRVTTPGVEVSARRGYYAAEAAAAASTPAVVVPTLVTAELSRLSRIRPDADVFSYVTPTPGGGAAVVVELSAAAAAREPFRGGAEVRVDVGDGVPAAAAKLAPGTRGVVVPVAADLSHGAARTATVTVAGDGDRVQDQVALPSAPDAPAVVGTPIAWRAMPSPRSPVAPVADFQWHRAERLHVEWPIVRAPSSRTARLLDRRGQPLGGELPLTVAADGHALVLDLPMAALPEGDFLVDLTAAASGQTERRVLAFRVVR